MSDLKLIEAVKAEDIAAVKELLESNADVHQQDEQGWTPLNYASGKGNLEIVKLLLENGADVFKVGRDQRTPYMIALAAGRVEIVKYLRDLERKGDPEQAKKRSQREKKYCKAYYLKDLRVFPGWSESRINWKEKNVDNQSDDDNVSEHEFTDDDVVFIHQDHTATRSMYYGEDIIYNEITPEYIDFLENTLDFKVPDDLDLIVPNNDDQEKTRAIQSS